MSDDPTRRFVRLAVSLSALCHAVLGALLLFAPQEVAGALASDTAGGPLVQVLGAALLGFAAMNWVARASILGGIYGRAVVAGNQTHSTIGALLLLTHGLEAGGTPSYWLLTGTYVLGAALFAALIFCSGVRER
jgi:hypothetical protein